ncbi:MAG: hypothetical protein NZL87_09995 [Thermomicrobium sp.]|nr:hypothetical protein [Thermomicrobium sp.]MDW7982003.1 hypothetical protein [Thermomicrobium sp.]
MPQERRSSRLEEQILEILEKAEREPRWRRWLRRLRRPRWPRSPRLTSFLRISLPESTVLLAGAFLLALLAVLVRDWSRTLAVLLAIASLLSFFTPIVRQLVRGPTGWRPDQPRRWRGRDIDLPPPRRGLLGWIRYQWWRMRQRR